MCPGMETMLGNALYPNREICYITKIYGINAFFMPKTNATFRSNGIPS